MDGRNGAGELAAGGRGARDEVADAAAAQGAEQQMEDEEDVSMEEDYEEFEAEMADSGTSDDSEGSSEGEETVNENPPVPWRCACMRRRVPPPPPVVDPETGGSSSSSATAAAARLPATPVERRPAAVAPTPAPLQLLLDACRALLGGASGAPPMFSVVPYIRGLMDRVGPDDVAVMDDVRFFRRMNTRGLQNHQKIITSKTIYEGNNFKIATFFLPRGVTLPLHDHPGMTVFSNVIIGAARMEAYDWVRPRVLGRSGPWMLAEKVRDHDVTAAVPTWVLFPDAGGNMHRFTTGEEEHCMFLDVLTPPYAEQRCCTYYDEFSSPELSITSGGQSRQLAWLKEIPEPSNMRIAALPFRGPQIF